MSYQSLGWEETIRRGYNDREAIWQVCLYLHENRMEAWRKYKLLSHEKKDALMSMLLMCTGELSRALVMLHLAQGRWPPECWATWTKRVSPSNLSVL